MPRLPLSALSQNCSLYLNAEPLSWERVHPLTTAAKKRIVEEQGLTEEVAGKSARKDGIEWYREGTYRFTFSIYTPGKTNLIAQKEAPGYSFSHTAQNWGWSGFCSRDRVYFNNVAVKEADAVIITVSLTCHPVPAKSARPKGTMVPKTLLWAMSDLLDDPELSDVRFHFPAKQVSADGLKRWQNRSDIHGIRKILMHRCEYFRNLLGGDFAEAEAASSEDDDDGDDVARDRPDEPLDQDAMALDEDHQQQTTVQQSWSEEKKNALDLALQRRRLSKLRRDTRHDTSDAEEDELDFGDGIFADSDAEYGSDEEEEEDSDAIDEDEDVSVSEDGRADASRAEEEESPSQTSDSGHAGGRESRASGSASGHAIGDAAGRGAGSGAGEAGEEEEEEEAVEDDEIAALSRSGIKKEGGGEQHQSSSNSKTKRESDGVSEDLTGKFSDLATVSKPKK